MYCIHIPPSQEHHNHSRICSKKHTCILCNDILGVQILKIVQTLRHTISKPSPPPSVEPHFPLEIMHTSPAIAPPVLVTPLMIFKNTGNNDLLSQVSYSMHHSVDFPGTGSKRGETGSLKILSMSTSLIRHAALRCCLPNSPIICICAFHLMGRK